MGWGGVRTRELGLGGWGSAVLGGGVGGGLGQRSAPDGWRDISRPARTWMDAFGHFRGIWEWSQAVFLPGVRLLSLFGLPWRTLGWR